MLLELSTCLRLFGGLRRLHRRVRDGLDQDLRPRLPELGPVQMAWAPSSLAALALARAGQCNGLAATAQRLDALPLRVLTPLRKHQPMLARLGCRCLADVRALPRAGLSRRFGEDLVQALDRCYGLAPEAHAWVQLPEVFESRLELPYRIDQTAGLLTHIQPMLMQLSQWLTDRHAGVDQLTLAWQHDTMRARDIGPGGEQSIHLAAPSRDAAHLLRLLAEHLAHVSLLAPVSELRLHAQGIRPMAAPARSLLMDDPRQQDEAWPMLMERLSARLGAEQLRCARLQADHRPEHMQVWLPWAATASTKNSSRTPEVTGWQSLPQPSWLLSPPLRLATREDRPLYHGMLQLLLGPQRLEGGWWGTPGQPARGQGEAQLAQRDYYLARSPEAGLLWVYLERLSPWESRWFLQGVFA